MAWSEMGSAAPGVLSNVFKAAPGPGTERLTDWGSAVKLTETTTDRFPDACRTQLRTFGFSLSSMVSEPAAKAGLVFFSRIKAWYQAKRESELASSALTLTGV